MEKILKILDAAMYIIQLVAQGKELSEDIKQLAQKIMDGKEVTEVEMKSLLDEVGQSVSNLKDTVAQKKAVVEAANSGVSEITPSN